MNQVKLGIIGLGNMGSGHCNNILAGLTPEIKLTAAADLRQSRRDWAKETLPDDVVLFENGDQLIESGLVRRRYHRNAPLRASAPCDPRIRTRASCHE